MPAVLEMLEYHDAHQMPYMQGVSCRVNPDVCCRRPFHKFFFSSRHDVLDHAPPFEFLNEILHRMNYCLSFNKCFKTGVPLRAHQSAKIYKILEIGVAIILHAFPVRKSDRHYVINVGIQNFESLRNDGYFYVDKTELMYRLVKTGRYYFLSRPRRFGKSLLISTLEAYFQGKKELFEGLAVHGLEKEWTEYPILHLDLNTRKYDTPEALDQELSKHLEQWEKEYGDEYSGRAVEERFYHIIRMAYEKTGRRVVILVDEYDKPMLQAIGDDVLQDRYRSTLKAFYGALKSQDGYIKFALLTGVTKFGKVSVFSDLNNLMDISRDERYTDICGISEKELLDNFSEDIRDLALANGQTFGQACAQLKEDYDGYHFCPDSVGIYNPFSLLNTFAKRRYGSYWFETGTPTYLVELLKKSNYDLEKMTRVETNDDILDSIFTDDNPIPVIYQSGYLTIKEYDRRFGMYTLGFPNREVEDGFMNFTVS